MCPEAVLRMPFVRFMAWQRFVFRRSVERRNADLKAKQDELI